jgi:hypothetical protein
MDRIFVDIFISSLAYLFSSMSSAEVLAVLERCAAYVGGLLPTFRRNISPYLQESSSSGLDWLTLGSWTKCSPEARVCSYQPVLCNNPGVRGLKPQRRRKPAVSRSVWVCCWNWFSRCRVLVVCRLLFKRAQLRLCGLLQLTTFETVNLTNIW